MLVRSTPAAGGSRPLTRRATGRLRWALQHPGGCAAAVSRAIRGLADRWPSHPDSSRDPSVVPAGRWRAGLVRAPLPRVHKRDHDPPGRWAPPTIPPCAPPPVASSAARPASCTSAYTQQRRRAVSIRSHASLGPLRPQPLPLFDLLAEPADETVRRRGDVPSASKSVLPLFVGQFRQQLARPHHIVRPNTMIDQISVDRVIVERHKPAADTADEPNLLEDIRLVLLRVETADLPERRPEIAHDKPIRWFLVPPLDLVQRIVLVLEIRAVEHHQDDEQAFVRRRADEWVLIPGPLAAIFERRVMQAESSAGLRVTPGR